jgi:formate dehydrogenase major subunit
MTNSWTDIQNTDLVIIMGGNAAEAHPCGFNWVTEAKATGLPHTAGDFRSGFV